MSQVVSSKVDSYDIPNNIPSQTGVEQIWPQCHTDAHALWEKTYRLVGLGFHLVNADGSCLYGAQTSHNVQSVTHAELDDITWAMENASDIGHTSIHLLSPSV
ncbi:unnamed protein product [Microthlaspi erraticum]|uniref:RNase H type-1 domain-containing protein n=1 Tax=Microthlaspi erraticum TaxID=1685480 RepID=A0A6D2INJ4_9BRAS|nr:unnamed protein product [Microthlaspi erraticum]